jgi:hypothetical protein
MFGRMSVRAEIFFFFFAVYVLFILNIPRYVVEKMCFFDLVVKRNHWMQKQATFITAISLIPRDPEEDLDVCVDGILIQLLYFLDMCQHVFFSPNYLRLFQRLGPTLWSSGQSSWLEIRSTGFDSRHYQKKKVVGLERGPLSLVSTTEKLLDRRVAAPV